MAGKLKTDISNVLCIIFDYSLIYVGIYVAYMNSLHLHFVFKRNECKTEN